MTNASAAPTEAPIHIAPEEDSIQEEVFRDFSPLWNIDYDSVSVLRSETKRFEEQPNTRVYKANGNGRNIEPRGVTEGDYLIYDVNGHTNVARIVEFLGNYNRYIRIELVESPEWPNVETDWQEVKGVGKDAFTAWLAADNARQESNDRLVPVWEGITNPDNHFVFTHVDEYGRAWPDREVDNGRLILYADQQDRTIRVAKKGWTAPDGSYFFLWYPGTTKRITGEELPASGDPFRSFF